MANLNRHDSVFLESSEFTGFKKALENAYGFSIKGARMPEHISFTSRKLILTTDEGQFFLKEKPVYASSPDRLVFAAEYQNWLSERLECVPSLRRTTDHRDYFEWKDRHYHVTPFRPGRIYTGTTSDLVHALEVVGRVRKISSEYKPSIVTNQIDSYTNILPSSLYSRRIHTREDEDIAEKIGSLQTTLTQKYESLPREYQACHGDMSLFNFLLDDSRATCLNDFDNAAVMPTVQDIAEFLVSGTLVNYIAPLSNQKYPVLLEPSISEFSTILVWCRTEASLSNAEKALLPVICEIAWLDQLVLTLIRGDYEPRDLAPALRELEVGSLSAAVRQQLSVQA